MTENIVRDKEAKARTKWFTDEWLSVAKDLELWAEYFLQYAVGFWLSCFPDKKLIPLRAPVRRAISDTFSFTARINRYRRHDLRATANW